jgi:hypothetical protein
MTLILISAGILMAVSMSALLVASRNKSKKAEESERGEIIRQLLALSEAESSTSPMASAPISGPRLALASSKPRNSLSKVMSREPNKRRYPIPGSKSPVLVKSKDAEVEEQIRRRAYELYQQRGGVDGKATDDWLQAKEEVMRLAGKLGKSASSTSNARAT